MLRIVVLLLLALAATAAGSKDAWAHGGGGFRGPGGPPPGGADPSPPPPPPPAKAERLPCDCGQAACFHCKPQPDKHVTVAAPERTETGRWGDLRRITLHYTLRTTAKAKRPHDGLIAVGRGERLAVVGMRRSDGGESRVAQARLPQLARRDYLYARKKDSGRPCLLTATPGGALSLRVLRVGQKQPPAITLEAYTFTPEPKDRRVRAYITRIATGDTRMLVVMPRAAAPKSMKPSYVDKAHNLALYFVSPQVADYWLGLQPGAATAVPCVHALESVLTGRGAHAVNANSALITIVARSRAPAHLVVGAAQPAKAASAKKKAAPVSR